MLIWDIYKLRVSLEQAWINSPSENALGFSRQKRKQHNIRGEEHFNIKGRSPKCACAQKDRTNGSGRCRSGCSGLFRRSRESGWGPPMCTTTTSHVTIWSFNALSLDFPSSFRDFSFFREGVLETIYIFISDDKSSCEMWGGRKIRFTTWGNISIASIHFCFVIFGVNITQYNLLLQIIFQFLLFFIMFFICHSSCIH